jgi:tetratricopeptide (TPR) repeat protein
MLDILKKEAKTGDKIKLFLISGQEPQGEILEISDSFIRLMTQEGKEARLFDKLIGGWEILESRNKEPQKEKTAEPKDVIVLDDNTPKTSEKKDPFQKIIEENHSDEEIEKPTLPGLKIVGKIDLDKIQPKKAKRKNEIPKTNSIRLIRAAKDLNLTMSQLVELAEEVSIEVKPKSNFLISENDFKKIKRYHSTTSNKIDLPNGQSHKNSLRLNSLGDLKILKDKIVTEEGKAFLPPNGIIRRYGRSAYGFITDKDNNDYFFRFSSVVDNELLERLEDSQNEIGTAVVCVFQNNGTPIATNVRLSEPIESLTSQAQELYDDGNIKSSQELLLLVLDSFPDYTPASNLLNKIKYDRSKAKKTKHNASNSYFRAKAELSRGNIKEAKICFEDALQLTDHRAENVVKELAYIYQREGNWNKSVELVKANAKKFNSSDPNSFIAFFYETEKIYGKAVEYLEKVKTGSRNDNIKLTKRKANAYYRLDQYDEAEKLIQEVLREQPEDRISQKIFEVLQQAKISGKYDDELDVIFNEAELASFTGGLSPFAQYALERCSFEGVPPADVRDEKFNSSTLKQLRSIRDQLGTKRPKDRASYLLTEAKLIEIIEPDAETEKLSALTKYFTTYCDYASILSPPVDVIRFFILEASKTSKRIHAIALHLPIYVYSFVENSHEAQKRRGTKIDVALKECLLLDQAGAWQGLADLFSTNSHVFSTLLTRLFSDPELKNRCVEYLNKSLNKSLNIKISKEEFKEAWSHTVEKRQLSKQRIQRQYQVLEETVSSEQFAESFNSLKNTTNEALSQTDSFRIRSIDEIIDSVFDFNRHSDFEDKERMHNQVQNHVTQLIEDIENSPTEFSFNILRRILKKLSDLVQQEFIRLVASSSPELDITLAGEGILHQNKRSVNFQVLISNKKGSAPISSLEVIIEDSEDFTFNRSDNISDIALKGGQERPMRLSLTMSRDSAEISAIPLHVICKYYIRGSEDEKQFDRALTLRFYSEAEFERIDNPFATTADSVGQLKTLPCFLVVKNSLKMLPNQF